MELNEYKNKLKSGELGGVYIFAGEEDYLKRYYLGELRRACLTDEAFAVFNHSVFDGKMTTAPSLCRAFTRYQNW